MRTKKFESLKFARYEQHFRDNVQDPVPWKLDAADRALKAGADPDEVANTLAPSKEDLQDSKAAQLWKDNTPCITVEDVANALQIPNVARWRYDNGVPKLLTAAQAAFALDGWPDSTFRDLHEAANGTLKQHITIQRTGFPTYGLINPKRPKLNPLDAASRRLVEAKESTVVGRWRILKALAAADGFATSQGLFIAKCIVCGTQMRVKYGGIKDKECPTCKARAAHATKAAEDNNKNVLRKPITVWVIQGEGTRLAYKISESCPEDAIGKIEFEKRELSTYQEFLSEFDREQQRTAREGRMKLAVLMETKSLEEAERQAIADLAKQAEEDGTAVFTGNEDPVVLRHRLIGRPKHFNPDKEAKAQARADRKAAINAERALRKLERELTDQKPRGRPKAETEGAIRQEDLEDDTRIEEQEAAAVQQYKDMVDRLEVPDF